MIQKKSTSHLSNLHVHTYTYQTIKKVSIKNLMLCSYKINDFSFQLLEIESLDPISLSESNQIMQTSIQQYV